MSLLCIDRLSFTYPDASYPVLREVSLSVERGDFVVLCGSTGSGKSTLLRHIKRELIPRGERTGRVLYEGVPVEQMSHAASTAIGFVSQDPEAQIVTDTVRHELAFGLENLGTPPAQIARRVAEMASYFGIDTWYDMRTDALSGGQKQLLNLASVMVMDPTLLLLDEPTAMLDPVAASSFLSTLKKLSRDFSLTVVLVEHRLEEAVAYADRLAILKEGTCTAFGPAREVVRSLSPSDPLLLSMPSAVRLWHATGAHGACPLTVREGRRYIEAIFTCSVRALPYAPPSPCTDVALEICDVTHRYDAHAEDVLSSLSFTAHVGERLFLLGPNGSGKSTALAVCAGLLRPVGGRVRIFGKPLRAYKDGSLYRGTLSAVPQDVRCVFLKNSVREELQDAAADVSALPFDLSGLLDRHPYDLSGGEMQLVALAKALATHPRLLLLDEPTKGLDAAYKRRFSDILRALSAQGITTVTVTHDVELAAACADRCVLFFRGRAVSEGTPCEFFDGNRFYTTAARRMSADVFDRAITVEDVAELCRRGGCRQEVCE